MDQNQEQQYSVGSIEQILEEAQFADEFSGSGAENLFIQRLKVVDRDGSEFEVQLGDEFQPISASQLRSVGDEVVLAHQSGTETQPTQTVIADSYRLPTLLWLSIFFAVAVIAVSKKKGLLSIVGMVLSVLVLLKFIVPQILLGANPILISLFGSLLIGSATVYLAHGYNLKSHIALFSMMSSLLVVAVLSFISVQTAALFGLGSEEAAFLQVGSTASINLQGLLLGGIMLGALGVLDDVTVSQVSVVFQLRAAKKSITLRELYDRSIEVGRDHVASLVNTLVLAYAGANMPLFILFTVNESVPTWVMLNNELIAEEIIRTLVGSMGLVLAVPFTTAIASGVAMKLKKAELEELAHAGHVH